jgi:hypothetical protein
LTNGDNRQAALDLGPAASYLEHPIFSSFNTVSGADVGRLLWAAPQAMFYADDDAGVNDGTS